MIKDWSKLLELIPEELIVDIQDCPVQRGADINMIIQVMHSEYGFRLDMIQHGEQGCTPIYNKWELYFTNDNYEQIKICMYGENLDDLGVYDISYSYYEDLGNGRGRAVCKTIYGLIRTITY